MELIIFFYLPLSYKNLHDNAFFILNIIPIRMTKLDFIDYTDD